MAQGQAQLTAAHQPGGAMPVEEAGDVRHHDHVPGGGDRSQFGAEAAARVLMLEPAQPATAITVGSPKTTSRRPMSVRRDRMTPPSIAVGVWLNSALPDRRPPPNRRATRRSAHLEDRRHRRLVHVADPDREVQRPTARDRKVDGGRGVGRRIAASIASMPSDGMEARTRHSWTSDG